MKAVELDFPVVLYIMLYKVVNVKSLIRRNPHVLPFKSKLFFDADFLAQFFPTVLIIIRHWQRRF